MSARDRLRVRTFTGDAIAGVTSDLARLRITVFREWPYLYDGTLEYESEYLAKFASSEGAIVVGAFDGDAMIGASTGSPMVGHADEFAEPFRAAGHDVDAIFYFGESVLLAPYRGLGLGHAFFDGREGHARALGRFGHTTFCRVVRPDDHPSRPADYAPLDPFWTKRGYAPLPGIVATYSWKDVGDPEETPHPMQFWMRAI